DPYTLTVLPRHTAGKWLPDSLKMLREFSLKPSERQAALMFVMAAVRACRDAPIIESVKGDGVRLEYNSGDKLVSLYIRNEQAVRWWLRKEIDVCLKAKLTSEGILEMDRRCRLELRY